ncbi:MAG: 3'-5' exonuclease [Gammaproteobacteria bacterium]|nr:3'-5' exonuclease [Gammaproteobacteria bacterium]
MSSTKLEKLAAQLEASDAYRVLRRLVDVPAYNEPDPELRASGRLRSGVYIDVETTGLDSSTDQVIELALLPFEFSLDGQIFAVHSGYGGLRDPGIPIPAEITQLTGIDDAMVKGQQLDNGKIEAVIEPAHLVVAHNAAFDRPFAEQLHPLFETKAWACSINDVPWREEGLGVAKLDYLACQFGFFYDAHRAGDDCRAGVHLLSKTLPTSGRLVLAELLDRARRKTIRIWALGSPFDSKDKLRERKYRWNGGEDGRPKSWYRDIDESEFDKELEYLKSEIFSGHLPDLPTDTINAFNRYSSRA